jgi:hypothetical protein
MTNEILDKKTFIKQIKDRWSSEINEFWQKILNFSLILGGSAGGVLTIDGIWNVQSFGVPSIIFTICGYILTACGAMGLAAKLTKA